MRVLVVEDDLALGQVVKRGLTDEGYAVDLVRTVAEADEALFVEHYDLVVLDLGLPDGDGVDLCRTLRDRGDGVPVLILTARAELGDRVVGLDSGADDYLAKPFDFPELAARLRALGRRDRTTRSPVLTAGSVTLDPASHVVTNAGITVPLTPKEFALLQHLMMRPGEALSRSELLERVWDVNYEGGSNVVDVHVASLRRKLEVAGTVAPVETVRGVGYRLSVDEPTRVSS